MLNIQLKYGSVEWKSGYLNKKLPSYSYIFQIGNPDLSWEFKKENKKVRKKERKHTLDQERDQEKKEKLYFFLGWFLGRERVSFFFFFLTFLFFFLLILTFLVSPNCFRKYENIMMHDA